MLRTVAVLLAATTASALLPGRGPALRRVAQTRAATPFLAADGALDGAAGSAVTDDIAKALGRSVVVMADAAPQSSNQLRNGAFLGLGVAAFFFASKTATGAVISTQLAYEVAHCTASKAKFFGFVGACCNWFLGLSALYDATQNGPENIALPMTLVMLAYSIVFCRWAGWAVMPRNFMLAASHMLNIAAQSNQLRRCLGYKLQTGGEAAKKEIVALGCKAAAAVQLPFERTTATPHTQPAALCTRAGALRLHAPAPCTQIAATVAFVTYSAPLKALMPAGSFLASDAGPFSIHPWCAVPPWRPHTRTPASALCSRLCTLGSARGHPCRVLPPVLLTARRRAAGRPLPSSSSRSTRSPTYRSPPTRYRSRSAPRRDRGTRGCSVRCIGSQPEDLGLGGGGEANVECAVQLLLSHSLRLPG